MTTLEYRAEAALGQIQEVNPGDHTFSLRIVNYSGGPMKRADSYGSVWEPGVFSDSLRSNPRPAAAYAHNWERIIGSLKEHTERADGLDGLVQFANIDEVPDAKMAWSLIRDGHLRDTSFGFKRQPGGWSDTRAAAAKIEGERERMTRARLDEVSPVLVGAVPGAGVLSVRSADGAAILKVTAADLLTKLAAKTITLRDALEAIETRNGEADDEAISSTSPELIEPTELTRADVEDAWLLMRADKLIGMSEYRAVGTGAASSAHLKTYWTKGKGAPKIGWGTDGDFARCEAELGKYVPAKELKGYCANLHVLATGARPGHVPGESGGRSDREPETEPSPT
jgi:HK97 family phage prohead protease